MTEFVIDGELLATRNWSFEGQKEGKRIVLENSRTDDFPRLIASTKAEAFSEDGTLYLLATGMNGLGSGLHIHVWDLTTGRLLNYWEDRTRKE